MRLEEHIKIISFDIDNIIKNIIKISKNYNITKIEFSKSYDITMIIDSDIICKYCPFLTHLDLGCNRILRDDYNLERLKRNLPKCNVIQNRYWYNCLRKVKETITYTFGTTYYYEYVVPKYI